MNESKHLLRVLQETKEAVRKEDIVGLKQLSNQTIHSASTNQDAESIIVAVTIYSLSKIMERTHYKKYPGWNRFFKSFMNHIDHAIILLKQNKKERLKKELGDIRSIISRLSGRFKKHIQDVFQKAKINKASRIYEHGISMEQTAKLLGINMWELAEYSGQTGISEVNLNITLPEKQRIKFALEMFK